MIKKIKSIISLLLIAAFVFPAIIIAEENSSYQLDTKEKLAVELSKGLGIFDENTDFSAYISRAEFVNAMYVISGANIKSDSATGFFADVDEDTPYNEAISAMYDMGAVRGYKGAFYPDKIVSRDEASVVAVNIMRLKKMVSLYNDEQTGYNYIAENFELFDGINVSGEGLTYLDTAKLIENILTTDLSEYSDVCGINGYYMSTVLDIYKVKGILNDNGMTSITDKESVGGGKLKIGNETFLNEEYAVSDMLGLIVNAYYKDTDGEYSIVAIAPDRNANTLILDNSMIEEFGDFEYTYYENEEDTRTKRARLAQNYDIVYNGTLVDDARNFKLEYMTPEQGRVSLIDTDHDEVYDVVIIKNYEVFVVSTYSETEQKLYSLNGKDPIDFKNADLYEITIAEGTTKLQIRNLAYYGYVLSVASSLDRKRYDIRLCSETVEGDITRIDSDDGIVGIDGVSYTVLSDVINSIGNSRYGKFYKNQYGELVYFEPASSTELVGFLMRCVLLDESEKYEREVVEVKIYSENNLVMKLPVYKNVRIDGVRYQNYTAVEMALESYVNTLIRFKVNANNEVTWIDTSEFNKANEDEKNNWNVLLTKNSNAGFSYDNFSWGTRYESETPADINSLVFVVKNDYDDESEIYCYKLYNFKEKFCRSSESELGKLTVYNTDKTSIIGTYALVRRDNLSESYDQHDTNLLRTGGIVTEVLESLNSEDEPGYSVKVERGDLSAELFFEENAMLFGDSGSYAFDDKNPYTIDKGDIIKWGVASDGKTVEAGGVQVIYDCDRDWSNSSTDAMSRYRYSGRWHRLWLLDVEKDFMVTVNEIVSPVADYASGKITSLSKYVDYIKDETNDRTEIYIFDKGKRKLYKGNVGDIKPYKNYRSDCSDIVGLYYSSGHRFMVVYK